jgi:hypothetical protein
MLRLHEAACDHCAPLAAGLTITDGKDIGNGYAKSSPFTYIVIEGYLGNKLRMLASAAMMVRSAT